MAWLFGGSEVDLSSAERAIDQLSQDRDASQVLLCCFRVLVSPMANSCVCVATISFKCSCDAASQASLSLPPSRMITKHIAG